MHGLAAQGPLSVSRLVSLLQELVEDNFVEVLVEGELSNFSRPASGHLYLTLKDAEAQLRGVMFRSQARRLKFQPDNGMQVICRGRISVYRSRGELQLIIESIEPSGVGGLQLAFEQLKRRLAQEGLFAEARKRSLPAFPRRIGVVTSATGAAIRDILNILGRRSVGVEVLVRPVRVQGEGAEEEIAAGIADLNRCGVDVMIVGRGGGSLEDLWAFNEEVVARAVHASACPVISAVGHETDWTICDFVADLRAPTPSAAAELVVRNRRELESHLDQLALRLAGQMRGRIQLLRERVTGLSRRLIPPQQQLQLQRSRFDHLQQRLYRSVASGLQMARQRLELSSARLDALSPLHTLARGYSIVFKHPGQTVVRHAADVGPGDKLRVRLAEGVLTVAVEESEP
ncbi:exodeoxyribonuclease VII large subunit [Geothermobacter hydrogeniphilus]|uniref:Exodeoxyribonuclease 7 large subunit n=1 Tax=Geothermobacter hydrogeniphilus TaxID=1969733 RepID=A0A1X0YCJ6_9BACT|nr:exodeoxyribonuclease VII large subunit [Geothermobacter hydrogeniphilus]